MMTFGSLDSIQIFFLLLFLVFFIRYFPFYFNNSPSLYIERFYQIFLEKRKSPGGYPGLLVFKRTFSDRVNAPYWKGKLGIHEGYLLDIDGMNLPKQDSTNRGLHVDTSEIH